MLSLVTVDSVISSTPHTFARCRSAPVVLSVWLFAFWSPVPHFMCTCERFRHGWIHSRARGRRKLPPAFFRREKHPFVIFPRWLASCSIADRVKWYDRWKFGDMLARLGWGLKRTDDGFRVFFSLACAWPQGWDQPIKHGGNPVYARGRRI